MGRDGKFWSPSFRATDGAYCQVLEHALPAISRDTIVEVWHGASTARAVADRGFRFILASSDYFYLVSETDVDIELASD
jgi:hypothetical protein